MKRILLISVILAAMLLSACGTPAVTEQPAAPTAPETESPSVPETKQPTVTMYTLSTSISPSGAGLLAPSGGEYEEGTVVTITAIANEGYAFDHWEGDAEGSDATATLTMDSDKNAFACFKTTESEQPKVDTFVELTSQIETDQDGVKVFGQTNLPNGAIVTVALALFDTKGSFGEDLQGNTLEVGKAFPINKVEVQNGNYNTFFDISYYAGGNCKASVEFYPDKNQPQFISDAFGKNGQYLDGERIVTSPPFTWGVMKPPDKSAYYRCRQIEFNWYSTSVPSEPTPETKTDREGMIEIFKANALAKWGDDYQMVNYEVDKQTEAYDWVVKQTKYPEIMERAKSEWQNDYEMVKYTYENQVEAYEWIMRQTAYPDIMEGAKQKWGGDYEMVKYEYEKQVEAYKALQ